MAKAKGKSLIGLDIGTSAVKAIELTPTDEKFAITGYVYREIAQGQNVKEVLSDIIHTGGFNTKKVITAVSGRSVIVRYITMPEMPEDELQNAIKYEASKYIPFEVDEVILDCQRLEVTPKEPSPEEQTANPEMRVLLVAVKKNLIDEHATLLESTGFWPSIIDTDSFALGNAFELHEMLTQTENAGDKSSALINIGATKTSVNIMVGMNSHFTREISIAGNDFTETIVKKMGLEPVQAELLKRDPGLKTEEIKEVNSGILEDLAHEIRLSFDYFEHQFERSIDDIYLSGGGAQLDCLDDVLEEAFQKKPIRWNPLEQIEIASEAIDPAELNDKSSQLAIAIGLASRIRKE